MAAIANDDLAEMDSPTFFKRIQALLAKENREDVRKRSDDNDVIFVPRAIYTNGYDRINV
jgi:hypothetical protein